MEVKLQVGTGRAAHVGASTRAVLILATGREREGSSEDLPQ